MDLYCDFAETPAMYSRAADAGEPGELVDVVLDFFAGQARKRDAGNIGDGEAVAVGLGAKDLGGAFASAGAGNIFRNDLDLVRQGFFQIGRDQPHGAIKAAAGAEGNDKLDVFFGKLGAGGGCRQDGYSRRDRGERNFKHDRLLRSGEKFSNPRSLHSACKVH